MFTIIGAVIGGAVGLLIGSALEETNTGKKVNKNLKENWEDLKDIKKNIPEKGVRHVQADI